MKPVASLTACIATIIGFLLCVPSAYAIPRTFVSGTGGGAACTRAAPCATFQAAHDATDLGGEIDCIDAGSYGGVTVSKSITIDCAGTLAVSGQIQINAPTATVRLRNLTIATGNPMAIGVIGNGTALFIENCVVTATTQAIVVDPQSGITTKLFVTDSAINRNGMGIFAFPNGGSVRATIDGSRIEKNDNNGLLANGQVGTTLIAVHVRNSVVTGNNGNIAAFSSSGMGTTAITVDRTSSTLSSGDGITASGPLSFILLGRSTVMSNSVGLDVNQGQIFSYKNNHLSGNATDAKCGPGSCTTPPTGTLTLK